MLERYLADLRHDVEAEVIRTWANSKMTPEYEQTARGTLVGAAFLQGLSLEQLRVFYGLTPRPGDDPVERYRRP